MYVVDSMIKNKKNAPTTSTRNDQIAAKYSGAKRRMSQLAKSHATPAIGKKPNATCSTERRYEDRRIACWRLATSVATVGRELRNTAPATAITGLSKRSAAAYCPCTAGPA